MKFSCHNVRFFNFFIFLCLKKVGSLIEFITSSGVSKCTWTNIFKQNKMYKSDLLQYFRLFLDWAERNERNLHFQRYLEFFRILLNSQKYYYYYFQKFFLENWARYEKIQEIKKLHIFAWSKQNDKIAPKSIFCSATRHATGCNKLNPLGLD